GIALANTSHLASILLLHRLTCVAFPVSGPLLPLLATTLHILSPAGLFLAAPYSEAPFAALTFLGYLLYAHSLRRGVRGNLAVLLAAAVLGAATTLRSNGLLSGVVLLHDFVLELAGLLGYHHLQHDGGGPRPWGGRLMRVLVLGIAGLLVAAGLVFPQ